MTYRCDFSTKPPKDAVPTCRQAGVLGVMSGKIDDGKRTDKKDANSEHFSMDAKEQLAAVKYMRTARPLE